DADVPAREVPVAAIDDPTIPVQPHRLAQTVLPDVGNQIQELPVRHHRENVGDRVKLQSVAHLSPLAVCCVVVPPELAFCRVPAGGEPEVDAQCAAPPPAAEPGHAAPRSVGLPTPGGIRCLARTFATADSEQPSTSAICASVNRRAASSRIRSAWAMTDPHATRLPCRDSSTGTAGASAMSWVPATV